MSVKYYNKCLQMCKLLEISINKNQQALNATLVCFSKRNLNIKSLESNIPLLKKTQGMDLAHIQLYHACSSLYLEINSNLYVLYFLMNPFKQTLCQGTVNQRVYNVEFKNTSFYILHTILSSEFDSSVQGVDDISEFRFSPTYSIKKK